MSAGFEVGLLVEHTVWGRGKILEISHPYLRIFFPQLAGSAQGPERKILSTATQLSRSEAQDDPAFARLGGRRRATMQAGRPTRPRPTVGSMEQVIRWFQTEFPGGFRDKRFISKEIEYKREAHALWTEHFGKGRGQRLLERQAAPDIEKGLRAVFQRTNIQSPFEKSALSDGLKDGPATLALFQALLGFLDSCTPDTFERLVSSTASLPAPREGSRVLTWPNVTIFPFFAQPNEFMVLKPEVAKTIAARMNWDLLYDSRPTWHCFKSWRGLSSALLERLAPLGASDHIDVQSFLWETRDLD